MTRPQLNFKVMNGLIELDRLARVAFVRLPKPRTQEEIAVARRWIRQMSAWWDARDDMPTNKEVR